MDEENIRIPSRVSGLEKHEYTKNMQNFECHNVASWRVYDLKLSEYSYNM